MRHPFERWLAEQDLSEEARSLLNEGVDAFMTNAFRAAFIMSYLGFMTVLRDRLLRADMPEGFTRSRWSTKIAKIRNSETWDGEVFTCVQQKTPDVFSLPEDLRLQVQFYKDRRNDCAHGKQNGMGYELVETFWSFVRHNLGRFVVNGSQAAIVEELRRHFDARLTRPGAPTRPIVERMRSALDPTNYSAFVQEVFDLLPIRRNAGRIIPTVEAQYSMALLDEMMNLGLQSLTTEIVEVLKRRDAIGALLRFHPERVYLLSGDAQQIRALWQDATFLGSEGGQRAYVSMLIQGLIPSEEVPESMEALVSGLRGALPSPEHLAVLDGHGFREAFEKLILFDGESNTVGLMDRFTWTREPNNCQLIIEFLNTYGLTDAAVRGIAHTFHVSNYPATLAEALDSYFEDNAAMHIDLLLQVGNEELPTPRYLKTFGERDERGTEVMGEEPDQPQV